MLKLFLKVLYVMSGLEVKLELSKCCLSDFILVGVSFLKHDIFESADTHI